MHDDDNGNAPPSGPDMRRRARAVRALTGNGLVGVFIRGATGSSGVRVLGQLAALGSLSVLTNVMTTDAFGVYAYAYTVAASLIVIGTLGLDWGLVRFVSIYRLQEEWSLMRGLLRRSDQVVLATSVGVAFLYAGIVWALRGQLSPALYEALWWSAWLLPIWGLMVLRQYTLRALKHVVLADIPPSLVMHLFLAGLAGLLFVVFGRPLEGVEGVLCLGGGLAAALVPAVYWCRRYLPIQARQAAPVYATREWLRTSLPMFLVSGFRQIMVRTDVLLIGALAGTVEAGLYLVASRLASLVSFGLTGVSSISGPMMAEYYNQGQQRELQRVVSLAAWGCTLSALVIAAVLLYGRTFLLGWFGSDYVLGATVTMILIGAQLINSSVGPVGNLLNMTRLQDENARAMVGAGILNAVCNVPAVWYYGMEGAAAVTGASIALKNLWAWYLAWKHLGINSSIFARSIRPAPTG